MHQKRLGTSKNGKNVKNIKSDNSRMAKPTAGCSMRNSSSSSVISTSSAPSCSNSSPISSSTTSSITSPSAGALGASAFCSPASSASTTSARHVKSPALLNPETCFLIGIATPLETVPTLLDTETETVLGCLTLQGRSAFACPKRFCNMAALSRCTWLLWFKIIQAKNLQCKQASLQRKLNPKMPHPEFFTADIYAYLYLLESPHERPICTSLAWV